jgi:hypothetical protein
MASGKKTGRKSQASNDFLEPLAPTSVTATDVPASRAYNNGRADVTFSLPANSPAATSYTVTSTPGSYTASGASSPISVTGLQSDTAYTFTVIATNAVGNSLASAASSSITATTVPNAPSAPSATAQGAAATDDVSWTAPATGGSAITSYDWESDDSKSGNTASTSVSVAQEAGTAQSYRVRAKNANGDSAWSSYSAQLTSFSFTPFSFAPFGAFGFTPFGFTPFGFTPFGFTPFGAFGFTPWRVGPCVHEDTLIRVPGGTVQAKDIQIDDQMRTIGIEELSLGDGDQEDSDWRSIAIPTVTSTGLVDVTVTAIVPSIVQEVIYFNGESNSKFSLNHPMFIKGNPFHVFIEAGGVAIGDILIKIAEDGSIIEVPVTSIDTDDSSHTVISFSCEPQDWFIAGDYLTHNK